MTKESVDRFDAKVRAGHLPMPQPGVVGRKRGKYTSLEALVMMIGNSLTERGKPLARASIIASDAYIVSQRMRDISETSADYLRGVAPSADIYFALVRHPEPDKSYPSERAFCGTFAELAAEFPNPIELDLVNVSRVASLMRDRSRREEIDLGNFWCEG